MAKKPNRPPRYREDGALLCSAHTTAGKPCNAPAMSGQTVCHKHGGAAPQAKRAAKLRLLELVDPAIATLAREMARAENSRDKQAAANSILDRAGYGRQQQITTDDARTMLFHRLMQAQQQDTEPEGDTPS